MCSACYKKINDFYERKILQPDNHGRMKYHLGKPEGIISSASLILTEGSERGSLVYQRHRLNVLVTQLVNKLSDWDTDVRGWERGEQ